MPSSSATRVRARLVARETAHRPTTATGRAIERVRTILFGRRLSIHEDITERLSKIKALAIFSSDPISSSAYATEEILRVLVFAGAGALFLSLPTAIAVAILLAVVSFSYRQIVFAYPSGGGDYAVARRNLPTIGALVVAGALLLDYVMTVAVSTASAAEQVVSAVPDLDPWQLAIGVAAIALITLGNVRGLARVGKHLRRFPTYLFVGSAMLMIAIGVYRIVVLGRGRRSNRSFAGYERHHRSRRHPVDHPRLRIGFSGPDRDRGDRQRRARPSSRPSPRTRPPRSRPWP